MYMTCTGGGELFRDDKIAVVDVPLGTRKIAVIMAENAQAPAPAPPPYAQATTTSEFVTKILILKIVCMRYWRL
jgi:hypothetical protein